MTKTTKDLFRALGVFSVTDPFLEQIETLASPPYLRGMQEQMEALAMPGYLKGMQERMEALAMPGYLKGMQEQMEALAMPGYLKGMQERMEALAMPGYLKGMQERMEALAKPTYLKGMQEQMEALAKPTYMKGMQEQMEALAMPTYLKGMQEQMVALAKPTYLKGIQEQMEALAASAKAFDKLGMSQILTVEEVLAELAIRAIKPPGPTAGDPEQTLLVGDIQSSMVLGDFYAGEVLTQEVGSQSLVLIPTWFLVLWLNFIFFAGFLLVEWDSVRANLVDMNARLPQSESFFEVRNFIRTELAGKPGDVRLVMGTDVRLREGPGMKSDVIMLLPRYAPVVVLGKEDRNWLFVSYEHEGYVIDGYVSTKLLKKVRK